MGILCLALVSSPGLSAGEDWTLAKEPVVHNLGNLVETATLEKQYQFSLPQTGQNHLLLYYVTQNYWQKPFQILNINLDDAKIQVIDAVLGRPGPHGTLLHSNGKIYLGSSKPGYFMVYDPATGQTRKIKKLADTPGAQYIIEGDDGAVYIGECIKGYVERYDPKDDSWENYGIIDDPGSNYYRYAYTLGADGRYVYIAIGQNPWYLVIYDRLTKSQKVYWKAPDTSNVSIFRGQEGGWYAQLGKSQGQHFWYKLKEGQPELLKLKPMVVSPRQDFENKKGWKYEIDLDQAIPDTGNGGQVRVRWRQPGAPQWQEISSRLEIAPFDIKHLYLASGSTFFGLTAFYGPLFTFDVGQNRTTILGRPGRSLCDALFYKGEWYLAGYPAATMRFDPKRPWNLTASTKDLYGVMINPRMVKVAPAGAAKYHYYLAAGADGYVYFGGHHERSGVGGALGWYHPKTGMSGGLREPFLKHDVSDLIAMEGGANLVFSGRAIEPGLDGKLFIFAADRKKLMGTMTPLPGERDPGKVIEVAPGVVLGVVSGKPKSRVYKADLRQVKVLWQKELEGVAFGGMRHFDRRLTIGPDGQVWLYINNRICRINPADGSLQEVMEAPPAGNLLFFKKELYIYGGTLLRKVSGLFKNSD
jgi:streptogramin lyase